jgi:hypothetical protein
MKFQLKGALIARNNATTSLNIIRPDTSHGNVPEVNPAIGLVPGFGFDLMHALGIRLYP